MKSVKTTRPKTHLIQIKWTVTGHNRTSASRRKRTSYLELRIRGEM